MAGITAFYLNTVNVNLI